MVIRVLFWLFVCDDLFVLFVVFCCGFGLGSLYFVMVVFVFIDLSCVVYYIVVRLVLDWWVCLGLLMVGVWI